MAVFKLSSDKHFLRTFKGDPAIYVFEYRDDPNTFDMIRASNSRWTQLAKVAPNSVLFNELEVLGVTIRSNQLTQLANDLTLTDVGGQTFHLIVNRQGLCFVYVNSPYSIMRLRVNDYFGWSKYGVNVGQASVVWDRWDMNSGGVLIWNRSEMGSGITMVDVAELKRVEEEMRKELEEKEKEVDVLKQLVERNKEVESMWKRSLEEKDKMLDRVMSAIRALIS
ncbi:hypothetical protein LINGRAHAP2_LOCUS13274 [Linum grandiflorum]